MSDMLVSRLAWRHKYVMLVGAQALFCVLGSGYYSFPMWLNQILVDHVDLSRSELSLLGGVVYICMGLCGALILRAKSYGMSAKTEFFFLTAICTVFVTLSWTILLWLVTAPRDSAHHFGMVLLAFCMLGLGIGLFWMVWFGKILELVKPAWAAFFMNLTSAIFTTAATTALALKFATNDTEWILVIFFANLGVVLPLVAFVCLRYDTLYPDKGSEYAPLIQAPAGGKRDSRGDRGLDSDEEHTDMEASGATHRASDSGPSPTMKLLGDLVYWRRNTLTREQLMMDDCDMTSLQFYLLAVTVILITGLGTTFMANLGPLTSNDSDTDSDRAQLLVMVWASAGQTLGRMLVPVIVHIVETHMSLDATLRSEKAQAVQRARINNRTTLGLSVVVAVIFAVGVICITFMPHVSFITASTVLSVGYGMMWTINCNYPIFLSSCDFTTILALSQMLGALGTLIFTLVVSLFELGNAATFSVLLVLSLATLGVTCALLVNRLATEPTAEMMRTL